MRVILDTNILISALMTRGTPPDQLYEAWKEGQFELVSCEEQLEELRHVSHRSFFKQRLQASEVESMLDSFRQIAVMQTHLPTLDISPDPNDNFLLALAQLSQSDFLVTGDKQGLLALKQHAKTKIVTARYLVDLLQDTL